MGFFIYYLMISYLDYLILSSIKMYEDKIRPKKNSNWLIPSTKKL